MPTATMQAATEPCTWPLGHPDVPYDAWWNGCAWQTGAMPPAILAAVVARSRALALPGMLADGRARLDPCSSCKGFKLIPCTECAQYPRPAVHCHLCHGDGQEVCGDCDGRGTEVVYEED